MKLKIAPINLDNPINEFYIIEETINDRINAVYFGRLVCNIIFLIFKKN